ncbi:hypothetical protein [Bacillus sp. NPDC094106]|uniref:hypothetical protein n=1 Tax=Bacillus sp. NPDC094106 TaxID=3363949 RepID=UPI00381293C0
MIKDHRFISAYANEFDEEFKKAVDELQSQGLVVEVQYSVCREKYSNDYSALLLGREKGGEK